MSELGTISDPGQPVHFALLQYLGNISNCLIVLPLSDTIWNICQDFCCSTSSDSVSFSHGCQDNQEFVAPSQVLGFAKKFKSVDLSDRSVHWISFFTPVLSAFAFNIKCCRLICLCEILETTYCI